MSINALIERIQAARPHLPNDLLNRPGGSCACGVCGGGTMPRNPDRKPGI